MNILQIHVHVYSCSFDLDSGAFDHLEAKPTSRPPVTQKRREYLRYLIVLCVYLSKASTLLYALLGQVWCTKTNTELYT